MAKRAAISPKTRFEVFKRDGFVCVYCGGHPPNVVLQVDHIVAVAAGGNGGIDNLTTSCDRCNIGKGARDLKVVPARIAEKASLLAEKEAQLRGYQQMLEGKRERLEHEAWKVIAALSPGAKEYPRNDFVSIKRFLEKLGLPEVLEAVDIVHIRLSPRTTDYNKFKFFCGVCWRKIKAENGDQA